MDKVARFEERRTKRWILWFLAIILVLVMGFLWAFLRSFVTLSEQHTFDVLELLWEDREIITEFWQDTLSTVVTELPQWTLTLGTGFVVLFVGIWISTRRKRTIARRRMAELAKRKKNYNNTYSEVKE
ncbi:MAG TPA: hypothetical protein VJB96_03650 [Patescibacteria group bacterium]|nr:hypothetical protein [Patescibacteria group bacterium]